jgi:hypothetical protein
VLYSVSAGDTSKPAHWARLRWSLANQWANGMMLLSPLHSVWSVPF